MSGHTLAEITAWLLLAAALGFVLGWIGRELQLRARRGSAGTPGVRPAEATGPVPPKAPAPAQADEPVPIPAKKAPAKKTPTRADPPDDT